MTACRHSLAVLFAVSTLALGACGMLPLGTQKQAPAVSATTRGGIPESGRGSMSAQDESLAAAAVNGKANEVVLFALGLLETGYRFGGKNPEAGLDCSGMVSYVYRKAISMRLAGSAADLAESGRPVPTEQLRPGDLVFFNTRNQAHSHVGIYIGDQRFIHAPNSRGKVRTDSLKEGWFAVRFEEGRTYLD